MGQKVIDEIKYIYVAVKPACKVAPDTLSWMCCRPAASLTDLTSGTADNCALVVAESTCGETDTSKNKCGHTLATVFSTTDLDATSLTIQYHDGKRCQCCWGRGRQECRRCG